MENHSKSLRYHGSRGSLAWRKLDVCHLWRHPRCGVGCGALLFPGQGKVSECYSPHSFHGFLLPLGSTNSYLQCSRLEPRVLPGDLTHFSRATIGGVVPFRLAEWVLFGVFYSFLFHFTSFPFRPSSSSPSSQAPLFHLSSP